MPICRRCGEDHYNFRPCPNPRPLQGPIQWETKWSEGLRPFGDRFDFDYERLGENTFVLKKDDGSKAA